MSTPETIGRLFAPFMARTEARTTGETQALVLEVHAAVAKDYAEAQWLTLSCDPRFIDGSMPEYEVNKRLQRALMRLLGVVGDLHVAHGLHDRAFNEQSANLIIDTFEKRCKAVAINREDRGRG